MTFDLADVTMLALQRWRYRVDGCFLWSTGSWDVLAVYPESTSVDGSYFDPVVADIISTHNKKAWLQRPPPPPPHTHAHIYPSIIPHPHTLHPPNPRPTRAHLTRTYTSGLLLSQVGWRLQHCWIAA